MNARRLISVWFVLWTGSIAIGQNISTEGEIEKARRETLARATMAIEEAIDAKVLLEVDVASFGDDAKAWSNLPIIANRLVGALSEVGKDQVGKDAIAGRVRKVVIARQANETTADTAELKDGTLTVQTAATDNAVALLQGVITRALEKAL